MARGEKRYTFSHNQPLLYSNSSLRSALLRPLTRFHSQFTLTPTPLDKKPKGFDLISSWSFLTSSGSTHTPEEVGSTIISHLLNITSLHLGHNQIKTAVISVPTKFNQKQRQATALAFKLAGIKVTRILEEPEATALAYGLVKKPGVNFILVYDFGGGTLDVR